mgnify:CR=1 FL=1
MRDILLGAALILVGIEYARARCQTTYVTVGCDCCADDEDGKGDEESAPADPDGGVAMTLAESLGWAG